MQRETEQLTDVIFRKYKEGDIIALFPGLAGTWDATYCLSYQHLGQHGSADLSGCISDSLPATDEASRDLRRELESLGYCLNVIYRPGRRHAEQRLKQVLHLV